MHTSCWHDFVELCHHPFAPPSCVPSYYHFQTHHHHHHHLSVNCQGHWGTTDDFTTSFLHFSLFSTALWDLVNSSLRGQHIVVRKCYINSYCAARKSWIISKTMFLKLWIYFSNVFIAVGYTILPAGFRGSCYSKFCCTWFCSVQKPPVIAAFFHSDLMNILNQLEKCYHPSTQHSRMICLSSIHRAVAAVSISDSLYVKVL